MVARLQAGGPEHVGQAVGLGVQLGVGDHLAGGGHDHGRPVGGGGGEVSREHGGKVAADTVGPWLTTRRARFAALAAAPAGSWPLDEALLLVAAHARPDLDVADGAGAPRRPRGGRAGAHRSTGCADTSSSTSASPATGPPTTTPATPSSPTCSTVGSGSRSAWPCSRWRSVGGAVSPWRAIGMPGHFVARSAAEPHRYLDAFDGGRELDRDGLPGARGAGGPRGAVGRRAPRSHAAHGHRDPGARQPGRRLPASGGSPRALLGAAACASSCPTPPCRSAASSVCCSAPRAGSPRARRCSRPRPRTGTRRRPPVCGPA